VIAATGVILAAVYMLWMVQRVMYGPVTHEENRSLTDLNLREIGLLVPLVVFMVWIGIRSADFTRYSEQWVATALHTSQEKAQRAEQSDDLGRLGDDPAEAAKAPATASATP
jgi:NADH-quinone oxidoreductase subunit M